MPDAGETPPLFAPYTMRGITVPNRVVVSPMDMYSAVDGLPTEWHFVHYGSRAIGGAGLIVAEDTAITAAGRITPGCAGLYTDAQVAAWRRITDFVHAHTASKIAVQLGHAGRRGSTKRMFHGQDDPLPEGNWEIVGPSPIPYGDANQTPTPMTREMMVATVADFRRAAEAAVAAGFDAIELHCAHGYLLSSFLSPIGNVRNDEYGGELANRLRYPLEVFDAMRASVPDAMPVGVRISASDLAEGGNTPDDAVAMARAFADHGADYVAASSGGAAKWTPVARPTPLGYVPFARRIKHEAGVAAMCVGNINSVDEVNGILEREDADLVALGRAHLRDPYWTLHAAQALEYRPFDLWPIQYTTVPRQDRIWRRDRLAAGG
jgi:anthraniloyl-CoA monooxygenase